MDEMEKIELIDRYLRNELGENEKNTFDQKVVDTPGFKQDVEDMKISQEVIRNYAMREEIKSIRKSMLEESNATTTPVSRSFGFYASRIAASILLLILVLGTYQYASLTGDDLYAEKAMVYHPETYRSGQNDTESNLEEKAISLYQQENYHQYTENYKQLSSPSLKATFLAGNAFLQQSENTEAITAFQQILEANKNQSVKQFQEDAEYYLALAQVKNGNYSQAHQLMKSIADNQAHKYHEMINTYYLWKLKMMEWKDA